MRGFLVALEGIDGSGLTTHSRLLAERLKSEGYRAVYTKEPTWGPIGSLIRELLYREESLDSDIMALLYAADRLWHLRVSSCAGPGVLRLLEEGYIVVSDRYKYSSIAYQGSWSSIEWVEALNSRAPDADLVVYVDVPVEVALARIEARGARAFYEKREILEEVKRVLEATLARAEARGVRVARVRGVKQSGEPRSVSEVHEEIYSVTVDAIKRRL
ncbi:MAG: dTMP kinase [Acidilobaceae archaeon]